LANLVRESVEKNNAKVVVIDSLNGYLNAMPSDQYLTVQLHELLTLISGAGASPHSWWSRSMARPAAR